MPKIYSDTKNQTLEIISYSGDSKRKEIFQLKSSLEKTFYDKKLNFFRQKDNHAYINGNIFYEGDCKNNIIISPYLTNKLVNIKNTFVFVGDSFIEVSPISDISNVINKGKKKLSNQEIVYHIPKSVFERENLIEKDLGELKRKITQKYGIRIKTISKFNKERVKNSMYYIKDERREYILKFRGRNKNKAELLSMIAENVPNYFPLNFHRKDSSNFTFEIEEESYGLEELIRNLSPKVRDVRYFSLLGAHIGLLHRQFSDFIKNNKEVKKLLVSVGGYANESNLISLYLDLSKSELEHKYLLSELDKIIEERLDNRMSSLPRSLIHKDLNHSNLIWQKDNFKIIDSETIEISNRLNEFESPLLFEGNMEKPKYVKGSLYTLINSYNQSSDIPLSKEEIKILPYLIKYTLLKKFVIRKIRRGVDDIDYLEWIKRNLNIVDEDSQ